MKMERKSRVLLFTGKSGSGKDSLAKELTNRFPEKFIQPNNYITRFPRRVNHLFLIQQEAKSLLNWIENQNIHKLIEKKEQVSLGYKLYYESDDVFLGALRSEESINLLNKIVNTKVEVSEDYTSHVPHKELFMEIHENRIINSLLKINNETPYTYWFTKEDYDYIVEHNYSFSPLELYGNYYTYITQDILLKSKEKMVLLNMTPNTWDKIIDKLVKNGVEVYTLWIDVTKETSQKRMQIRGDKPELIKERLENDIEMWSDEVKEEKRQKGAYVVDGNGVLGESMWGFMEDIYYKLK